MYKLALFEQWWREHYGPLHQLSKNIKNHYIIKDYIELEEFYESTELAKNISEIRRVYSNKPIYRNKNFKLGIVKGFNYKNYEVCIDYTCWINILIRKYKNYYKKRQIEKNKNIKYIKTLNLLPTIENILLGFI